MVNFFIGAVAMASLLLVISYVRKKNLHITWWQWTITILGFLYGIFVLEVIVSFLAEGAEKAALIMGTILGVIAIIWGVLLGRFIFKRKAKS